MPAPSCSPGEWGRVLFNERFGLDDEWRYAQIIVNFPFRTELFAELFTDVRAFAR